MEAKSKSNAERPKFEGNRPYLTQTLAPSSMSVSASQFGHVTNQPTMELYATS